MITVTTSILCHHLDSDLVLVLLPGQDALLLPLPQLVQVHRLQAAPADTHLAAGGGGPGAAHSAHAAVRLLAAVVAEPAPHLPSTLPEHILVQEVGAVYSWLQTWERCLTVFAIQYKKSQNLDNQVFKQSLFEDTYSNSQFQSTFNCTTLSSIAHMSA